MNEKRMEIYAALTLVVALALVGLVGRKGGITHDAAQLGSQDSVIPLGEKIIAEKIEDDPSAWSDSELPEIPEAPKQEPNPAPQLDPVHS